MKGETAEKQNTAHIPPGGNGQVRQQQIIITMAAVFVGRNGADIQATLVQLAVKFRRGPRDHMETISHQSLVNSVINGQNIDIANAP